LFIIRATGQCYGGVSRDNTLLKIKIAIV